MTLLQNGVACLTNVNIATCTGYAQDMQTQVAFNRAYQLSQFSHGVKYGAKFVLSSQVGRLVST